MDRVELLKEELRKNQARRIEVMSKATRTRPGSERWAALRLECAILSREADEMVEELRAEGGAR